MSFNYTCFFYKHDVKHIQAQVWRFFTHMLSITLSLAKCYYVNHFSGQHEFFHTDYDFFCYVLKNIFFLIRQKCSKINGAHLRPGGLWYYTLCHNNNNTFCIIIFEAKFTFFSCKKSALWAWSSLFRKYTPSKILMNKHNASILCSEGKSCNDCEILIPSWNLAWLKIIT